MHAPSLSSLNIDLCTLGKSMLTFTHHLIIVWQALEQFILFNHQINYCRKMVLERRTKLISSASMMWYAFTSYADPGSTMHAFE